MIKPLNILVGFEESQAVTLAFRSLGHNAFSNDIKECSGGYDCFHLQMDIHKAFTAQAWDIIILHPPCTYTAQCGNRWYYNSPLRTEAAKFCKDVWDAANEICDKVALEQPKTIMQQLIGPKTQVIHPWQYGHGEQKETWLWLRGLPLLVPTCIVQERDKRILRMGEQKHRRALRAKTYPGIANAFALQWGGKI